MTRKLINIIILSTILVGLWFLNQNLKDVELERLIYTTFAVTLVYVIFRLVFEELLIKNIKGSKARYSFRKAVSVIFFFLVILITFRIWARQTQSLLVAYGLVGAGVAIALQDFFRNFVGGMTLFLGGNYKIGDRIEINGKHGDIIDIGMFYTTLLEIKEWVKGDQATGRLVSIPNGQILANAVKNYSKDHGFIWDEITLPLTYESDWKKAKNIVLEIARSETIEMTELAEKEITKIEERYYVERRPTEPSVYVKLTDNWIEMNLRYVTFIRERRVINARISELILEKFDGEKDIKIASQTITVNQPQKS